MQKLLVANRSEIAIRVFRAATELGLGTVAVYSYEDRFSLHRFKADESFLIGPPAGGEPVRSYLTIDALIDVARACEASGIAFIGPTSEQLDAFGDKTTAKELAIKAGVPTLPGTQELTNPD